MDLTEVNSAGRASKKASGLNGGYFKYIFEVVFLGQVA